MKQQQQVRQCTYLVLEKFVSKPLHPWHHMSGKHVWHKAFDIIGACEHLSRGESTWMYTFSSSYDGQLESSPSRTSRRNRKISHEPSSRIYFSHACHTNRSGKERSQVRIQMEGRRRFESRRTAIPSYNTCRNTCVICNDKGTSTHIYVSLQKWSPEMHKTHPSVLQCDVRVNLLQQETSDMGDRKDRNLT